MVNQVDGRKWNRNVRVDNVETSTLWMLMKETELEVKNNPEDVVGDREARWANDR